MQLRLEAITVFPLHILIETTVTLCLFHFVNSD